jgi:hypothetical protein
MSYFLCIIRIWPLIEKVYGFGNLFYNPLIIFFIDSQDNLENSKINKKNMGTSSHMIFHFIFSLLLYSLFKIFYFKIEWNMARGGYVDNLGPPKHDSLCLQRPFRPCNNTIPVAKPIISPCLVYRRLHNCIAYDNLGRVFLCLEQSI